VTLIDRFSSSQPDRDKARVTNDVMMKSVGQPAKETRETRMRDECFEPQKVVEKPMSRIRQPDKQSVRSRDIKRSNGGKTVMSRPACHITDSRSCKSD